MRVLNASVLASLLAIVTPPESGAVYFKGDFLHVGTGIPKSMPVASFDLARLAQLIQAYIEMPGIPEVK